MDIEENKIRSTNNLINIILSIINWEKNKETLFIKIDKINEKEFYLFNKNVFNKLKKLINYENLEVNLNNNASISKEDKEKIINEHISKNIYSNNKIEIYKLLKEEKINNEEIIIKELIENKNFIFEIINKEVKNSLNLDDNECIKLNLHIFEKSLYFTADKSFKNKKLILMFFNEYKISYKIIFIIKENNYESLINIIESKKQTILNFLQINLNELDENIILKNINLSNISFVFLIKKLKEINIENKSSINEQNNIINIEEKPLINKDDIYELLKSLMDSNETFKSALNKNTGENNINYSPCKIINKLWAETFINKFNSFDNINEHDFEIFKDYKYLIPQKQDLSDIYIIDEISFISLFPFFKDLEKNRNIFEDIDIYLNDNKGLINIREEIFIFETINNDVNQRINFINIQNKYEFLKKIKNKEFELNETNWKKLKSNINLMQYQNQNQIIFNSINENIINKGNIDEIIFNLFERENQLNKRLQQLNNIEQNLNNKKNSNNNNNIHMQNNDVYNNINNGYNTNAFNNNIMIFNNDNANNINNNVINPYNNNNNNMINNNNVVSNNININNNTNNNTYNNNINNGTYINNNNINIPQVSLNRYQPTIGLTNLGATCYINATLQCLAHCIEISEEILSWYLYSQDKNKESKNISFSYAKVLYNLFFPKQGETYYSPTEFRQITALFNDLFEENKANDSKDIFQFLTEQLHQELNDLNPCNIVYDENMQVNQLDELAVYQKFELDCQKQYHSIISKYLYGKQKTITKCLKCGSCIHNYQVFSFIIFPLLDVKNYILSCSNNNMMNNQYNLMNQNRVLNLYDCFNYFQKMEYFQGENVIYCMGCNQNAEANYCNYIFSTPTIFAIILNRGKNNVDFHEKFLFPTELNLDNHVMDGTTNNKFYLIGVICHLGESSMNGHFLAYCRSHYEAKWYQYSDALVKECNETEIFKASTPYILFYHKFI